MPGVISSAGGLTRLTCFGCTTQLFTPPMTSPFEFSHTPESVPDVPTPLCGTPPSTAFGLIRTSVPFLKFFAFILHSPASPCLAYVNSIHLFSPRTQQRPSGFLRGAADQWCGGGTGFHGLSPS